MPKKIFKYPLEITDEQVVEMPEGAKIISVQTQNNQVCLWVIVEPMLPKVKRGIRIYGTGHPIDRENLEYIGTAIMESGNLVWHVFEVIGINEYFIKMAGLNK